MKLISLVRFLKEELQVATYPIQFPFNSDREDCIVADIVQGRQGVVTTINLQLMARSTEPEYGEELLSYSIEKLHNLTNLEWDGYQIVLITADNTNPFFLGLDENKKYIYHTQFRVLVSKI